ncbi:hypothetical protein G9A89_007176 [Geosiphon pyriformis]|nr:hypothetical protein G9A89_007176 [Geosiphon pyriformis]
MSFVGFSSSHLFSAHRASKKILKNFGGSLNKSRRPLFNKTVKNIIQNSPIGSDIEVYGWVRSVRKQKNVSFAEINDGTLSKGIQAILKKEQANMLTTGTAVKIKGKLIKSPGNEQNKELQAENISIFGECDPVQYPLQKKHHSFEFLREIPHLRSRSNTFTALARVRNYAIIGFENFLREHEFVRIQTPVLTTSDSEGGGKVFEVFSKKYHPDKFETQSQKSHMDTKESVDKKKKFFEKPVYLTVSGQLHAEVMASALSRVYTFGPVFRAEESETSRHLAEFWMLEAEVAFVTQLEELLDISENLIRNTIKYILDNCSEDLKFFNQWIDTSSLDRIEATQKKPFVRMTYNEAIDILANSQQQFIFVPKWGQLIQSEHEKYLATDYCCAPVFITDYPRLLKPFYMRSNQDGTTVACMDLLVPKIGELIGGSLREERYANLQEQITENGLDSEEYQWYLDLRKFGSVPHGGYGLGFDRFLQFITGLDNIRDVVSFPRAFRQCKL